MGWKIHQQRDVRDPSIKREYLRSFGELHEERLTTKGTVSKYLTLIKLIRWVITIFIMVLLRDYYAYQIMILLFISFMMTALVVGTKLYDAFID